MKKIIFSAIILFCLDSISFGQTTSKTSIERSRKKVSKKSTSLHTAKASKKSTGTFVPISSQKASVPDNRKEYMQNGQKATYTGHQATRTNTDEFVGIKKKTAKKSKGKQ